MIDTNLDWIKTYSIKELEILEKKNYRTIKKSHRYIPIMVENWLTTNSFRRWVTKKPYSIKYIRYSDLKDRFENNHDKKLTFL